MRAIVPIFMNILLLVGALLSICILSRVGKKTLLQFGTLVLSAAMLLNALGFFILSLNATVKLVMILIGLLVYNLIFGMTFGSIIWAYVTEIV